MRRTYQVCRITTTIDFTYSCGRDNIDIWVAGRCCQCTCFTFLQRSSLCKLCFPIVSINRITILVNCRFSYSCISIDRIRCQIATSIQLVNLNRRTTFLFNVNGNSSSDGSCLLVTTEYLRVVAIGDSDMHIVEDIRILRSTIELITFSYTVKDSICFGIN